jgi:hypothetical protein
MTTTTAEQFCNTCQWLRRYPVHDHQQQQSVSLCQVKSVEVKPLSDGTSCRQWRKRAAVALLGAAGAILLLPAPIYASTPCDWACRAIQNSGRDPSTGRSFVDIQQEAAERSWNNQFGIKTRPYYPTGK